MRLLGVLLGALIISNAAPAYADIIESASYVLEVAETAAENQNAKRFIRDKRRLISVNKAYQEAKQHLQDARIISQDEHVSVGVALLQIEASKRLGDQSRRLTIAGGVEAFKLGLEAKNNALRGGGVVTGSLAVLLAPEVGRRVEAYARSYFRDLNLKNYEQVTARARETLSNPSTAPKTNEAVPSRTVGPSTNYSTSASRASSPVSARTEEYKFPAMVLPTGPGKVPEWVGLGGAASQPQTQVVSPAVRGNSGSSPASTSRSPSPSSNAASAGGVRTGSSNLPISATALPGGGLRAAPTLPGSANGSITATSGDSVSYNLPKSGQAVSTVQPSNAATSALATNNSTATARRDYNSERQKREVQNSAAQRQQSRRRAPSNQYQQFTPPPFVGVTPGWVF